MINLADNLAFLEPNIPLLTIFKTTSFHSPLILYHHLAEHNTQTRKQTMALNPYSPFSGFNDYFAPTPLSLANDPLIDRMPVVPNFLRGNDMQLVHSSPGYEINETDDKYSIIVDVPGVRAQDMAVNLESGGRVLHVVGGRKIEKQGEVRETKFDKRFTIGDNIDQDKLTANLDNGILVLEAPKKPKKQEEDVRSIMINEGSTA